MSLTTEKMCRILIKLNADFISCSETYDTIIWKENAINKPTESEIQAEISTIENEMSFKKTENMMTCCKKLKIIEIIL